MNFLDHVKECTKANGGKPLTRDQLLRLREAYRQEKQANLKENKNAKPAPSAKKPSAFVESCRPSSFADILKECSAWKKKNGGDGLLTKEDISKLREAWKISESTKKRISEAVECLKKGRQALREDDMNMAADAANQAIDTMGQIDPNATAVDPNLQGAIQAVLDATDQLAQQAGLSTGQDLNQQADGAVPPVGGQPVDPNAAQPAAADPNAMVENARNRRAAMLKQLNEKKIGNGSVGAPSTSELIKGKDGGNGATQANIWKPTPIKYSKTGAINEKAEQMIDNALNETKLNFKDLIKNGFFG